MKIKTHQKIYKISANFFKKKTTKFMKIKIHQKLLNLSKNQQ